MSILCSDWLIVVCSHTSHDQGSNQSEHIQNCIGSNLIFEILYEVSLLHWTGMRPRPNYSWCGIVRVASRINQPFLSSQFLLRTYHLYHVCQNCLTGSSNVPLLLSLQCWYQFTKPIMTLGWVHGTMNPMFTKDTMRENRISLPSTSSHNNIWKSISFDRSMSFPHGLAISGKGALPAPVDSNY